MANIYKLDEEQKEILDLLFFLDENDEEDKKVIEFLDKKLNIIRGDADNTALFFHKIYLEAKGIAEQRKAAKIKAQKRQTTAENAAERLRLRIIEICEKFNLTRVIDEDGEGLRTQLSPGSIKYVEDFDYSKLPIHCRKTEIVPINKEVKALIDSGIEIDGVSIVKNLGIRVV